MSPELCLLRGTMIGLADEVEVTTDDEANRIGATTKDPTVDIPGARNKIPSGKLMVKILKCYLAIIV